MRARDGSTGASSPGSRCRRWSARSRARSSRTTSPSHCSTGSSRLCSSGAGSTSRSGRSRRGLEPGSGWGGGLRWRLSACSEARSGSSSARSACRRSSARWAWTSAARPGTNLVVGFFLGVAGFATHAVGQGVDWAVLAAGFAGAIPGGWLGARATGRVPENVLRVALGAVLVLVALAFAVQALVS